MNRPRLGLCLALGLLLAAPVSIAAQKLETGTWTGSIATPDGDMIDVTFDVRTSGDTTTITMIGEMGSIPLDNVKVLADRITLSFTPGPVVSCVLMRNEDGSYKGDCTDPDGGKGVLTMIPPKKDR